jgi:DNA-binding MarR family transcriptional regulator
VTREQAPDDKRQVLLSLTERGAALLERLSVIHRDELRRLRPELTGLLERLADGSDV